MSTAIPGHLEFHPLANFFPLVEAAEFDELVADIRAHGVREPIWLYDGQIIDGRNRYRASTVAGVDCPMREYTGDDPVAFVVSLNLKRRHLSESQRAMVAAKLATFQHGGDRSKSPIGDLTQQQAADLLNVGKRSVERAADVREQGIPELIAAVEKDKVSISAAAVIATVPSEEQREIVLLSEREIVERAKAINARKAIARREERLERLAIISKANIALNTSNQYPIIYADPPWRYENPPMGDTNRSIENHYPTMTLDEICALPVADLAAEDAMLYLWATAPKLAECMQVIESWRFEYRTCMIWDKELIGMGYYARNQHELLLICRRGNIPTPEAGTQPSSVYRERRGEYSAKPVFFQEMIEAAYPQLPKIELFCRSPREGWAAWGNQAAPAASKCYHV